MRALPVSFRWASTIVFAVAALGVACSEDGETSPPPTAPTSTTPTASATPFGTSTPVAMLPYAPDGRSGVPSLDALIELLLRGQADELASRFTVDARQICATSLTGPPQITSMPPTEWTARFTSASRSLYAVFRGQTNEVPSADYQMVFSVSAADAPVGWRFYANGDRLVDVVAGCAAYTDPSGPRIETGPASYAPSVVGAYDRFVVLPPRDELPKPQPGYPMSMRSGVREVDAILDILQRRDLPALNALVSTQEFLCSVERSPAASPTPAPPPPPPPPPLVPCPDGAAPGSPVRGLPEFGCFGRDARIAERPLLNWAVREGATLHGVASVPDGHQPDADYVVMLVTPEAPFRWGAGGLLLHGDRIVAAVDDCGAPAGIYPPSRYVVPPPPLGQAAPEGRSAGVASLDRIIAAMRAQDAAALLAATDFDQVACVAAATGIGGPPLCRAGEPAGTVVAAITMAQCEGAMVRRDELLATYTRLLQQRREVFAVTDRGERESQYSFGRGRYELVFEGSFDASATPEQRFTRNMSLIATERGVTLVRFGCGPGDASELISPGRAPGWLVAPPGWQPPS